MSEEVWELARFSTDDGDVSVLVSPYYKQEYDQVEAVYGEKFTESSLILIVPAPYLAEVRFMDLEEKFLYTLEELGKHLLLERD